ncbi:MAG: hypothetical protein KME27_05740 [Lyngbya sp. HA4199-MV5]|jgi:hypothetical protein|nr:hypothetical protein [Lyngbya sp. HA4199-MV5]
MVIYLLLTALLALLLYITYSRRLIARRIRQRTSNSSYQPGQSDRDRQERYAAYNARLSHQETVEPTAQISNEQSRAEQYAAYKLRSFQQEIGARQPWFDPRSPHDLKVTTYLEPQHPIEVDTIENLRLSQSALYAPRNQFIVYQQWGERPTERDRALGVLSNPVTGRIYYALTETAAVAIAEIIRGGPTRNLMLLCTTFMPSAIRAFVDTLTQNETPNDAPQLEFLGLFWYFSGDDITDEPEHSTDVAYAANSLRLKRLTVLTGAFNDECEDLLVAGLQQNTTLEHFGIFHKNELHKWKQIPTPKVDALISANRNR